MTLRLAGSEVGVDLRDSNNLLLRQLSAADRARLESHFTEEPLAFKQPLLEQGKPANRVYSSRVVSCRS
jgi:hypothetical protein